MHQKQHLFLTVYLGELREAKDAAGNFYLAVKQFRELVLYSTRREEFCICYLERKRASAIYIFIVLLKLTVSDG